MPYSNMKARVRKASRRGLASTSAPPGLSCVSSHEIAESQAAETQTLVIGRSGSGKSLFMQDLRLGGDVEASATALPHDFSKANTEWHRRSAHR